MKILFNTDQIYLHGGIEKVLSLKANYFSTLDNVEVSVLTTEQKGLSPCYHIDEKIVLSDLGINYNRSKSYFSFDNLKLAFSHFWNQYKFIRKNKPDAIISPNYNFDHYWLPFIKGKAKIIKERHSSRYQDIDLRKNASLKQKIKFRFEDWIDSCYDAIVVLNEDEKAYVKSGNAVVIPNPILYSDKQANMSAKQVLAAGRISPVKNFKDLIEAWSLIASEFPDWKLDIYGGDYSDTLSELSDLVDELNLGDVINFKEPVSDIYSILNNYSIYAMTSISECFPMVLLEAMSVGIPIVSYDCPNGPRNIITKDKDGFLIKHLDVPAFAEGLKQMISDENIRIEMSKNSKININRFNISEVMAKWVSLLNL